MSFYVIFVSEDEIVGVDGSLKLAYPINKSDLAVYLQPLAKLGINIPATSTISIVDVGLLLCGVDPKTSKLATAVKTQLAENKKAGKGEQVIHPSLSVEKPDFDISILKDREIPT